MRCVLGALDRSQLVAAMERADNGAFAANQAMLAARDRGEHQRALSCVRERNRLVIERLALWRLIEALDAVAGEEGFDHQGHQERQGSGVRPDQRGHPGVLGGLGDLGVETLRPGGRDGGRGGP